MFCRLSIAVARLSTACSLLVRETLASESIDEACRSPRPCALIEVVEASDLSEPEVLIAVSAKDWPDCVMFSLAAVPAASLESEMVFLDC